MQICKTVTLRTKKLKNGMLSYYLDYYPGLRDNITMKIVRHEFIGIYIYPDPKTKEEIQFNKEMAKKAEVIRCRRYEDVVSQRLGILDERRLKGDFLAYYRQILKNKNQKWEYVYQHFEKFVEGKCRFIDVDLELCKKFHDYLLNAKGLKTGLPLARNSVAGYWSTFRGFLNVAYRDRCIKENVNDCIGYYGEQLVLLAQTLGLNTCWVGLSYSKVPGTYVLDAGEVIEAYISIGYGETQGVSHKIKRVEQVSNANDLTPSWFRQGVEAALLAPTAVNQQKFFFEYIPARDGKPVRVLAKRNFSLIGFTQMDLGIAKCHFEIGAGKENFEWA